MPIQIVKNRFSDKELGEFDISPDVDLSGADLSEANLSGADLREADLSWADLREADLSWTNLRGAGLREANLSGADLREADLSWVYLRWANLRGADLRGANLRGANLRGTDLRGADLREADLSWVYLRWANLNGADLRGTDYNLFQVFQVRLNNISDELTIELMRQDAENHPHPEKFQEWADGKACPLNSSRIIRAFNFKERRELWQPGSPTKHGWQLWQWIAKEMEIKID